MLLVFGYYTLFEYGVLSRSYVLGELFLFAFLALYPWGGQRAVWAGVVLFLEAQTSFFGLIVAFAGLCCLVLHQGKTEPAAMRRGTFVCGVVVTLAGLAVSFLCVRQHPDSAIHTSWDFVNRWQALRAGTVPWRSVFPMPAFRHHFWNTNVLDTFHDLNHTKDVPGLLVQCALSLAIVVTMIVLLRKRPAILTFYLVITLGCLAFFYTKKLGYVRHHGHLFLAWIGALWLVAVSRAGNPGRGTTSDGKTARHWRLGATAFTVVLVTGVIGGAYACATDLRGRFAASQAAAEWIRAHGFADRLLVSVPAVAAHLDQDVYLLPNDRFGRFFYYRKPFQRYNARQIAEIATRLEEQSGRKTLIVLSMGPETRLRRDKNIPGFRQLVEWNDCIMSHDDIAIYERDPEQSAAIPKPSRAEVLD